VVRTRVGYTGGTTRHPTYHNLGDHSESIEVVYDPSRISYEKLLEIFWASHDPASRPWSRQYMAAIFYHDEGQKLLAERTRDREARRIGRPVHTGIFPASVFTPAEEYHQKFQLRRHPELMKELRAAYPDPKDLVSSTAAARLNGYLGGYGTYAGLTAGIEDLGLGPEGRKTLLAIVRGNHSRNGGGRETGAACSRD
jgi:peptide-methionine (S)-S-oxide reductase